MQRIFELTALRELDLLYVDHSAVGIPADWNVESFYQSEVRAGSLFAFWRYRCNSCRKGFRVEPLDRQKNALEPVAAPSHRSFTCCTVQHCTSTHGGAQHGINPFDACMHVGFGSCTLTCLMVKCCCRIPQQVICLLPVT